MLELVVRAFDSRQNPSIFFEFLNDLPAVHGGYDNHCRGESQAIDWNWRRIRVDEVV